MKMLVTGASGQLGYDVCQELDRRGIKNQGLASKDMDLRDLKKVREVIGSYRPDAVIHCAAYTKVDKAEEEPTLCWAINVAGTEHVALACRETGAKLLYISTDYVFPGTGKGFYRPEDSVDPQNVYGLSKLAGELAVKALVPAHFIVRTSWVFGLNGSNFVRIMLRLAESRKSVNVVCDQIGSPTYTADLAPLLCDMVQTEKYGIYHATNEGLCSWAEFAEAIFAAAGRKTVVHPIPTSEYPTSAFRPKNSRMDKSGLTAAGFKRLPGWQSALERYVKLVLGGP